MECDHALLLQEFDADHAWSPRDRVHHQAEATYLEREKQNVFDEMEELEKYLLSPIDAEGIIGVLARSVCDHLGQYEDEEVEAMKAKKTTLVENMKRYAAMRAVCEKA